MSTPGEGPPSLGGQGALPPQVYEAYDPRSNGLTRQPTNPYDMQSSQNLSPQKHNGPPTRSLTDPDQHQHQQQQQPQDSNKEKPRGRSKICGKCGEGLTGQFVRALGDTYHLECFTCHVCIPHIVSFRPPKERSSSLHGITPAGLVPLLTQPRTAGRLLRQSSSLSLRSHRGSTRSARRIISGDWTCYASNVARL